MISAPPFEWAGIFDLVPGIYRLTFAKAKERYPEPTMAMLVLPTNGRDAAEIKRLIPAAVQAFQSQVASRQSGQDVPADGQAYKLVFDDNKDVTVFTVRFEKAGTYAFFTEHNPSEFEAGVHFFTDAQSRHVEPIALATGGDHESKHAHGHAHHVHQDINPHLFVSPRMAALLAENIAQGLSQADPEGAAVYASNAKAYAERMKKLADDLTELAKTFTNRRIVQPHGVFDYLARDIGLEIVAAIQPHGHEPSAAEMLDLVRIIRETKAGAVFTEPQYSPKVGQAIAREAGFPTAMLDPGVSGPDNAPLDYYELIMRKNMETLRATFAVKP